MSKFTVILDACVLYPAPLRDTLMRPTLTDLFKAHWTDDIGNTHGQDLSQALPRWKASSSNWFH
ncbi:MAG: hypothetical protein CL537_04870 [Alcanivoracaceae bacterium]|nr:hypothetical protein [Alcanivoracaceae bacterium]